MPKSQSNKRSSAKAEGLSPLQALADLRQQPVLALCLNEKSISHGILPVVSELLRGKQYEDLICVVAGSGGSPDTAFVLLDGVLRRHAKNLEAVVPTAAFSALSLLVLGMSSITMMEYSQLAPVDIQEKVLKVAGENKVEEGHTFIPANDIARGTSEALRLAVNAFVDGLNVIGRHADLSEETRVRLAGEWSANVVRPIIESIPDAATLGRMSRGSDIPRDYLVEMLGGSTSLTWEDRRELARHLCEDYADHGTAILTGELIDLGFNARVAEGDEEQVLADLLNICSPPTVLVDLFTPGSEQTKEAA